MGLADVLKVSTEVHPVILIKSATDACEAAQVGNAVELYVGDEDVVILSQVQPSTLGVDDFRFL